MMAMAAAPHAQKPSAILSRAPDHPNVRGRYLFYLHGRIIEEQGARAVSPDYGRYEYAAILQRLSGEGFTVISEVRPRNTKPGNLCRRSRGAGPASFGSRISVVCSQVTTTAL
jgi:hypothetical protein